MKTPKRLLPLVEEGLIDEVLSQLMSGKEATVYIVRCGDEVRCAKVYKEAHQRSFRQAATYQEGRKVKNSRQARAMEKGSRYGKQVQEETWQNAEVDALFRLARAQVRVPTPFICTDGVLLMQMVADVDGDVAPRLADVPFDAEWATRTHDMLLGQVVRMLLAGMIHGDLSEYNILMAADGPVIIDLPQAIDAAGHSSAAAMFERDVDNLKTFFGQYVPALLDTCYGKEIWQLYQAGELTEVSVLTGKIEVDTRPVDMRGLLDDIEDARLEALERARREQESRSG